MLLTMGLTKVSWSNVSQKVHSELTKLWPRLDWDFLIKVVSVLHALWQETSVLEWINKLKSISKVFACSVGMIKYAKFENVFYDFLDQAACPHDKALVHPTPLRILASYKAKN